MRYDCDILNVCSSVHYFFPLILWKVWRGSLGVKILLGFYYASQSQRVLVICSSQLERLRCSPPPLAVLPAQRHLLIPASSPEPVPAASFSPLPPTVMVGASAGNNFEPFLQRGSTRREFWPVAWYLVTRDSHPLTSRWPLSPGSCLSVRKQSWMPAFMLCLSFHAFLPNADSSPFLVLAGCYLI